MKRIGCFLLISLASAKMEKTWKGWCPSIAPIPGMNITHEFLITNLTNVGCDAAQMKEAATIIEEEGEF